FRRVENLLTLDILQRLDDLVRTLADKLGDRLPTLAEQLGTQRGTLRRVLDPVQSVDRVQEGLVRVNGAVFGVGDRHAGRLEHLRRLTRCLVHLADDTLKCPGVNTEIACNLDPARRLLSRQTGSVGKLTDLYTEVG